MDARTLLEQLLEIENKAKRQALLKAHRHLLDTAFFQVLKEHVLELVRKDPKRALRIADIGLEAAEFVAEKEGVAYAWWARGNALLFLGQLDDCLAAYSTVISIFAGLGRTEQVAQLQTNCMLPLMYTGRYAEAGAMGRSALEALAGQGEPRPTANLLLNLGICALRQGDHSGSLAHIQRATDIFAQLDDAVQVARCRVTQAVALRYLDRFAEAETLLLEALQIFAEDEAWVPWARAALNLGIMRARLADHQGALHWLEESRRAFLKAEIEMDAAVADLYRIRSFLAVNLLPEAAALGEELVETFTRLVMPRQVARASSLLAEVYARRGDAVPARRELDRARQIFCTQGDKVEMALLDVRRAALLRKMGRPGEASRLATEAADVLDVRHYPLRHAEAHLVIAACCEDLGMIEEAQVAYQVAWAAGSHPTGTTEPPPVLAYRIAYARGTIAEAAGDRALARGEYGRAVDYLVRITQGLGLDELRGGYLVGKRPVYEAALRLALEEGRVDEAFRYSELARAGALRDFLAGRRESTVERGAEDADVREELKARWTWRVSTLRRPVDLMAEAKDEGIESEDRPARLRELADLERELADAFRRRRLTDPLAGSGRVPRFAVLEQGEILGVKGIRQYLPGDAALLAYDHVGDQLLTFVITRDGAEIVPLGSLAELRWDATGLGHALEEVRLFDDPADLAMLETDLQENLRALYQTLLAAPLARLGPTVRQLLIVPCSVLHTLPIEASHDGRHHLLERYAVCHLPAASLLAALPQDRALSAVLSPPQGLSKGGEVNAAFPLVMGHSWDGRLPLTLEEATRVTQALASGPDKGEPLLLTEEQATSEALRAHASTTSLLHIAAHGSFRGDAPLFSSLHLADGPLTVNEVYELGLSQAALVTLSGCQTGLARGWGGEMLGLAHAFFFAGAPALVVSRWRVDDATTVDLMGAFYEALMQGETVAEALRTAQLGILARRSHAYYWAGFAVWGRGFDAIFHDG
jgi:tetratricopeptide (TPR) repeat protein